MSDMIAKGLSNGTEGLARFGHHPDPAIDFEIEVEKLQSRLFSAMQGLSKPGEQPETIACVAEAISKAMDFRVGGDQGAVAAKALLRELEAQAIAALPPAPDTVEALVKAAEYTDDFMRTDKAYERSGAGTKLRAALAAIRAGGDERGRKAETEANAIMPEHVIRVASMLIDSLHCLDTEAIQIATATNASGGVDGVQVLEDAEKIIKAAAGLVATELQGVAAIRAGGKP
ncbi:hypothetical protein [Ralstonia sp.]|uniref:hypothetical protein n=1 Tax=Ralstonia sp. TaxID=54061 RepID=UPI00257A3BE4|nr:hypothetical protein [Ralstonia sp.]MBA4282020.1 hypothetical protein [Ralstonia sp.]